ncbi:MAG: LLM class flavin-dependent oxidoreductase [Gaiellales bacterium]
MELIRELWTGEVITRHGRHHQVDTARIYRLPDQPPPIYMSAFGPKALEVAGRIADGFISVQDDGDTVSSFKKRSGGKPAQGGYKVAWADTEDEGVAHAHRLWANAGLPGELGHVLPSPQHFEQASQLVTVNPPPRASWPGQRSRITRHRYRRSPPPVTTRCTSRTWARTTSR